MCTNININQKAQKLPNLICPGAAKAGTTTLFEIFKQHPDIYLPKIKETFFFWNNDYKKGKRFYEKYYKDVKSEKIIGDFTPLDMYFEYIAERIFETLGGNVKFIFMLRNPMHRAYSHYLMNVNDGIENMSFETALKLEKDRISTNLYSKRYYSYQDRGYYGRQIAVF